MSPVTAARLSDRFGFWLLVAGLACLSRAGRGDPAFSPGASVGTVTAPQIVEASGLAASRNNPNVLWTHNDSGDAARIFAISTQGKLVGTYNITQPGTTSFAPAVDFEDVAVGPGPQPELSYVYVGDIGDNPSQRDNIVLYRIAEPVVYERQNASPVVRNLNQGEWQAITLFYPDGAHNAETLLADARTGDVLVGTKQGSVTRIYRAAATDLASSSAITLTYVTQVPVHVSTGGDISPTGSEILIRGYNAASLWTRGEDQTLAQALAGSATTVPIASEPQGEALAFDSVGSGYFTLSEHSNQPLYLYERVGDGPQAATTLVPAEAEWKLLDDGSDQGVAWREPDFDDSGWGVGPAQLGYGDGDEQTVVGFGPDPSDRYVTTYFRKTFQVDPALAFDSLVLKLVYDDGIAVYLNGTEVARRNLASDASSTDRATATQYALENTWFTLDVNPNLLVPGTNTLAVEVHQASPTSSDVSFDLQLRGTSHARSVRLSLTEINGPFGLVAIEPEPNDPNAPDFDWGTVVQLTALPNEGRCFREWQIYDPCHPDDVNHAVVDPNASIALTMTADRQVTAVFACCNGTSLVPPLIVSALVLLTWVRSRR